MTRNSRLVDEAKERSPPGGGYQYSMLVFRGSLPTEYLLFGRSFLIPCLRFITLNIIEHDSMNSSLMLVESIRTSLSQTKMQYVRNKTEVRHESSVWPVLHTWCRNSPVWVEPQFPSPGHHSLLLDAPKKSFQLQ
jgi:hypothetical protein